MKKNAKVALLGENYFPPISQSHVSNAREMGLSKVMSVIMKYRPSMMYICPTRGVNINLLPHIIMNEIPFRLVFPSKSFFSTLSGEEKGILQLACAGADKVIILSERRCDPLSWSDDWFAASEKAVNNSDWVLLASNCEEDSESWNSLLTRFDGNPTPVLAVDFGAGVQYQ